MSDGSEPEARKPAQAPNPPKATIELVREWLEGAGFPLEMRVASVFQSSRYQTVAQGDVVLTDDGPREVDITASEGAFVYTGGNGEPAIFFDLYVVCECKSNPQKHRPWVVFTNQGTSHYLAADRLDAHGANEFGQLVIDHVLLEDRDVLALELFSGPVGYAAQCVSIHEKPRENSHDPAYAATTKVMSVARAMAKQNGIEDEITFGRIVIPLVVIDTDLFECSLDSAGKLHLQDREEMALLFRQPGQRPEQSIIYIVTERRLPAFSKRIRTALSVMIRDHESFIHIDRALRARKARAAAKVTRQARMKKTARKRRLASARAKRD